MGKEANINRKTSKTPVLMYRFFLKISMAGAIYGAFAISTGTAISASGLPLTLSVMCAIAYEIAYFIYKSGSEKSIKNKTEGQILVLIKLILFIVGIYLLIYGSDLVCGKKYYGILFQTVGLVFCQQIHNNRRIFSHLSTFCENAGTGVLLVTLKLIYERIENGNGSVWVTATVVTFVLYALSEVFFHFYNIGKHKGDKIPQKKLVITRAEQFVRNALIITVVFLCWTLLALTGSIKAIVEASLYDKITKVLPILISLVTVSVLLYNNFIKKPKVEYLRFNPKPSKSDFRKEIISKYGENSVALKALDYVTENMNLKKGYSRYNGDDYYVHPIAVAKILLDNAVCTETTVAVALLHDCVEDLPQCDEDFLKNEYGEEIAHKVMLVTKKQGIDYGLSSNMSEYLDAISEDRDSSLVKTADRMNNNSTMENRSEEKKKSKTKETKEQYLPFTEKAMERDKNNTGFYELARTFFAQDIR